MKPKYGEMMELEWFGFVKGHLLFPQWKIHHDWGIYKWIVLDVFWGPLQQIQDNMGMIIHTSENHG